MMDEWIESRPKANKDPHALTVDLQQAIVGELRL
jgi:hypothetical protein